MGKLSCMKCGSTDLERQFETHSLMSQKILADGSLSKVKKYVRDASASEPEWIKCKACNSEFDYVFDDMGKIELYYER